MGLTIHYSLHARGGDAQARRLIQALHQAAQDLPFQQLGAITDLSGVQCDYQHRRDDDPLRWLLIQCRGSVNTLAIRFDPAGRGHCLYTEALDLTALGTLDIQRAATIEFHNDRQVWEVRDAVGAVLHSDPSRTACLLWEQQYFNR